MIDHVYPDVVVTDRQLAVLRFIVQFRAKYSISPTCVEIAEAFGFKSPNASANHINRLKAKGLVTKYLRGSARSTVPTDLGLEVAGT